MWSSYYGTSRRRRRVRCVIENKGSVAKQTGACEVARRPTPTLFLSCKKGCCLVLTLRSFRTSLMHPLHRFIFTFLAVNQLCEV